MSLNPTGASTSWNFSNQEREGFSLEIWGTIVSLQEVQAREYNPNSNQPGRPAFWPDGNPKMNIRMGMAMPDGSLKSVTFGKAGKKQQAGEKPSLHMDLFKLTNGNMLELIGKTVHIWTWPANPNTGEQWQRGNPRMFGVEEVANGTKYELSYPLPPEFTVPELLANDGAAGGQPTAPAPQQMQPTQVPQMQGNFYAPPTAQPQPAVQPATQPQPMAQPAAQPVQQPMPATQAMPPQQTATAQMPQGMDPAVAAAMQVVGAVNVQPVADPTGGVYD